MTPARFAEEVRTALDRVTELQLRAQRALPDEASTMLVEALEELTTAFAELDTAQEELRTQNELLAASELRLVDERDRYRDLFEFAPNGYLVTDSSGVIREANEAARRLLNHGPLSLVKKPLVLSVLGEDRVTFLAHLLAVEKGERIREGTLRFVPRGEGAEPRTVDFSVVPYRDPETRAPMLRWQLRESTDSTELAQEVARLQEADRRKDEFLSVVAHELRTPLTPSLNAVQILNLRGSTDPALR